ncbi:hypothetical protein [Roseateles amylovorans]|uniref:DUF4864 domain-containing protein n=1 Tax=Roseateles amylovorans TaxID=2978473 RepID=A0ABY6B1Y1_9BURK|nr:hypothetical protein [Roseateles amylovorans]UXH79193.1 hypothetical protein N4261_04440 [Roseateles amylovorans]
MPSQRLTESSVADQVLGHAHWPDQALQAARTQFAQSTALSGAGWHGPHDIQTLIGLQGQFLWSEDVFQVRTILFDFDPGHIGSEGRYQLVGGWTSTEQGRFQCVPNNPAIGYAFIALLPDGGEPRTVIVSGMMTGNDWKIYTAVLNKVGPNGPQLPPFSAVRLS